MDKVLKYKFWILSGLVLPLALVGFFMANGGIQADTAARVAQLEGVKPPNAQQPNPTHTEVAKKLADQQERDNNQQLRELDAIQRQWFTWPTLIGDGLERDATGQLVYRGEKIPPNTLGQISVNYPDAYKDELLRVWLSVNPVTASNLPYSGQTKNKVFCPIETLPFHLLTDTPKIQEIWDAQEDIWLLEMLFTAINTTNQAATNVNDSAIREIMALSLFGGSGTSTVTASAAGATGGDGEYSPGGMEYDPTGQGGASAATPGAAVAFADGAIVYDPAMEYGSPVDTAAAAGPGGEGGEYMSSGGDGGLFGGAGAANAKPLRYIGFDPATPGQYRKRGFYLSLLIQEKKIPDFVVNLANLDPPILAGRWGFANNPYDADHLLRAGASAMGGSFTGAGGAEYMSGVGGGGAAGPTRRPVRAIGGGFGVGFGGGAGDEYNSGGMGGATGSLFASNDPRFPPLMPAQLTELRTWEAAKLGKDLVQLELSGVVTIFTPTVPAETPAEAAPGTDAATSETPPATEAPPATTVPAPPAADATTPEADPAAAPAADAAAPDGTPSSAPAGTAPADSAPSENSPPADAAAAGTGAP
jgi:hypothetical protein